MTDTKLAYLQFITAVARWVHPPTASTEVPLTRFSQLAYTLLEVAAPETRRAVRRSLLSTTSPQLIQHLEKLLERVGPEVAIAARDFTSVLVEMPSQLELLDALNTHLRSLSAPPIQEPRLGSSQREIGSLLMDLITGQRSGWDQVAWLSVSDHNGVSALSLLGVPLNPSERVSLSLLFVRGLARLHRERLEPNEGFAPERAILTESLAVYSESTERTQVSSLMSPEQRAKQTTDKPADVWTLTQLLSQLYQGGGLAGGLKGKLEIPKDVNEVLKRSLHKRIKRRFYSGRELKVVLEKPLQIWRARLRHDEQRDTGEIEASLTFDELTQRQDHAQEERVQARRKLELKLRRRLKWRTAIRQMLWMIILVSLIGGGIWWWRQGNQERYRSALALRAELDARDLSYQDQLKTKSADIQGQRAEQRIQWRYVEIGVERRPALVSVSKVTVAQYLSCIESGACDALPVSINPNLKGCLSKPSQQPINCISVSQAERFARSVDAELLTLKAWRWLVFQSRGVGRMAPDSNERRAYPWGDQRPSSKRAVLKRSNLPRHHRDEPQEVCQHPLGDSPDALCDLVGNLQEWVLLPERQAQLRSQLSQSTPAPTAQPNKPQGDVQEEESSSSKKPPQKASESDPFVGVVGADWRTRENALNLMGFKVTKTYLLDPGVGFRVIRWLEPPATDTGPSKKDPPSHSSQPK